jgi:hypothetical protein
MGGMDKMNGNLSFLLLLLMWTDPAMLNSQMLVADLVHLPTYWKLQGKKEEASHC